MKGAILSVGLLAVLTALFGFAILSEDADASYASTFGSDSVGADRIVFDSNGGSGGYVQYVLNGNSVYFPTEYKASGTSNTTYSQIAKSGYVLMGWSENSGSSAPSYYPGQSYTVTTDRTMFSAVWKDLTYDCIDRFGGNSDTHDSEAQHVTVQVGSGPGLTIDDETGAYILMRAVLDRGTYRYTLTVNGNGTALSSTTENTNTSISADWLTLNISRNGEFSFSGMPDRTGIFEISIHMQTKGMGGSWGDLEDIWCKWFVSVYDENDPSNIMHVTYNGNDCGYGPYHTAVKLPNSVTGRQKGWNVTVDGSPSIFPVGGSYTLVKKETVLTVNEYTFDEVSAAGVVGVIAYNANGGTYNGTFAELVPSEGYTGLKDGSIVTKAGYVFLGWNPTGNPSDVIYPAGHLYGLASQYTELKAVWDTSGSTARIYFVNPADGSQNVSFDGAVGYKYAVPENGFALSGYDFLGWSETRYDVGMGTPDVGSSVTVSSTKTYYAVFKPKVYECTIRYDGNGGTGTMGVQTETASSVPHYMTVAGCAYEYPGYTFAGWSENRYSESPSYAAGSSYCFTDSGDVTLYAVWIEKVESSYNRFYLVFNGNGDSVTNVPPQVYRTTSETSVAFYVPSTAPAKEGYSFRGWSDTAYGSVQYDPGQKIVLSLDEGQKSKILTLFAVWEQKVIGGDGTSVTVTFVGDSGTLRSVSVPSGNTVTQISAPSVEGRAFLGWFTTDGKWDFSSPVVSDMTLTAKYLPVFHLDIEGVSAKVMLDCTSSSTKVSFSDGFSATYDSSSIPAHTVANSTSGSVTVTVTTEDGTYTAVCHYTVSDPGNGNSVEEEKKSFQIDSTVFYVAGGIVGILALFVIGRMFL